MKIALQPRRAGQPTKMGNQTIPRPRGDVGENIPANFEFWGKFIFCTNLKKGDIDSAILDRCSVYNFEFTDEEILHLIENAMDGVLSSFPEITRQIKQEVYDFMKAAYLAANAEFLSVRLFEVCVRTRMDAELQNMPWKKSVAGLLKDKKMTGKILRKAY